jgi:hypothetical protein
MQLFLGGRGESSGPLSREALDRVGRPGTAIDQLNPLLVRGLEWLSPTSYALGWFVGTVAGEQALFHPGLVDGFSSAMVIVPAVDLAVCVLMNENLSGAPGVLLNELLRAFIPSVAPADEPGALPRSEAWAVPGEPRTLARYHHPGYGMLLLRESSEERFLQYARHAWPVREVNGSLAALVYAMGLEIPIPLSFEGSDRSSPAALTLHLAMDGRAAPSRFSRSRS